jgi:c-di-GMP-binding flagellar brake protein YcgR
MEEKRRYRRVNFREPVLYRPLNSQQETGCLGYDISSGGVRCAVNDFIPLGQELNLTLHLKNEQVVELTGRIVWIQKSPHSENYQVGLRFLNPEKISPAKQVLDRLLAKR